MINCSPGFTSLSQIYSSYTGSSECFVQDARIIERIRVNFAKTWHVKKKESRLQHLQSFRLRVARRPVKYGNVHFSNYESRCHNNSLGDTKKSRFLTNVPYISPFFFQKLGSGILFFYRLFLFFNFYYHVQPCR